MLEAGAREPPEPLEGIFHQRTVKTERLLGIKRRAETGFDPSQHGSPCKNEQTLRRR